MRVLTIFIDMIRANRLSTFNGNIKIDTLLDAAFKELGGTIYNNCFTPGPDTPRGMSSYYTGIAPYKNGCNTRLKWPEYFLDKKLNTVFDLFIDEDYKIDIFSSPKERDTGLFPEHISQMNFHNSDLNLEKYLSNIVLKDKHFVFISIPDYHWAFDDYGYSVDGEKKAYNITKSVWDIVFKNLNKDNFDHIFIFSDHGFKFNAERKFEQKALMLNEDRTNNILIHRVKKQNKLEKNGKLCSLTDLYATYEDILNKDISKGISLFSKKEHDFIVLEDHMNFEPSVNQNIELWAVVTRNSIYIRELDKAILIDRETRNISNGVIEKHDNILKNNSSFFIYIDEYEKIFRYRKNIFDKSLYMNGKKRITRNKIIKIFYALKDSIKFYLGKKYD
jgi:hypothetical protein